MAFLEEKKADTLTMGRPAEGGPTHGLPIPYKALFFLLTFIFVLVNGCAALTDGKFVGRDGKQTPFKSERDPYAFPKDPTSQP